MKPSTRNPFNGSAVGRPSPSELSFAGSLVKSFDGSRHAPALNQDYTADVGGIHNDGRMA